MHPALTGPDRSPGTNVDVIGIDAIATVAIILQLYPLLLVPACE